MTGVRARPAVRATDPANNKARSRGPGRSRFAVRASVVMAARAVHVAVLDFLGSGCTNGHNFHFKVEVFAGHGVVGVHLYVLFFDGYNHGH